VTWREVVASLSYKPGWTFKLGGPKARYLCVFATTSDSNNPARERTTQHMFEVPEVEGPADQLRWIFARLLDVERHEAAEFFAVSGHRPFYPNHQDEGSPYAHVERWENPC